MTGLLLVDVINHLQFPGGAALRDQAAGVIAPLLELRRRAHARSVPVIYANDNFGKWRATHADVVRYCARRAEIARRLRPTARDYFVLKAKNSAFFCTALEPLLHDLHVKRLIICGLTADNCVLFTAHDAYLRGYRVAVPSDAVASQTEEGTRRALAQMRNSIKAEVKPQARLSL